MSKYAKYGELAKCGAVDSKYFGRPNAFDEDVKRHEEEYRRKCDTVYKVLEDFINQSTKQRDNYNIIIEQCIKLKEKYGL